MPGFFEAFEQFRKKDNTKTHKVTIDGKVIEVGLQEKLRIQKRGEDKFFLDNGQIKPKPVATAVRRFPVLIKTEKGYTFCCRDPYWVDKTTDKGGFTWQTG